VKKGVKYYRHELFEIMLSYWDDFLRITNPMIVGTGLERFLRHSSGYAGRVDCVMTIDPEVYKKEVGRCRQNFKINAPKKNDIWLIDLKTSRNLSDSHHAQVWAYKQAWDEMFPEQTVTRMAILKMNGETGWEMKESTGNEKMWHDAMKIARRRGILFG
jgi:hypothetical protein